MDGAEFDGLAETLRRRSTGAEAAYGFTLIEGRTATVEEIAEVERQMGVTLPAKYKTFMTRYGGGMFGFVDLFPIADLLSVNDHEFPDRTFVAVAPVGTGDHWGFPVTNGLCDNEVWFHLHESGDRELDTTDFLEFVAKRGLK
jgi:hypothetical protein